MCPRLGHCTRLLQLNLVATPSPYPWVSSEISGMSPANATHILVFPHPAQGHLLPLLDLTNHLALRGLTLTVVVTPKNLPLLSTLLSAHPSVQALVLPLPPHPNLPPGVEHLRELGSRGNHPMVAALSALASPISEWFHSHPSPPQAILSDFFLGWTHRLAIQLGIPRFAFFSSGFFVSSVLTALFSDVARFKGAHSVQFSDLPGSPVFLGDHLPSVFRLLDKSSPDSRLFKDGFLANLSSWGCVFNSFRDLEGDRYSEHFRQMTVPGSVYSVGPLSLLDRSASLRRVNPDPSIDSKLLTWLHDSPDDSVLYVSFGSQKWLTEAQMQALGRALEKSRARFVWVVRAGPGSEIDGLEERVAGRGVVVKGWAPQLEILGHRAVGGFLSHCGWNSVLESVVAGVMLLTWPMEADQFINARMLVDDTGVAVRACEGPDTVPHPDDLGRVIKEAMGPDVPQRRKAEELKEKAVAAVKDGGSSAKELDDFVNELVRFGSKSC